MPLETGTYLSDLVASNPTGSDNKSTSDDHLRLIKSALKASFPNVAGAMTKTHAELNAAHDQRVPVGGIIMWSGALVAIPAGWLLCNGTSGTPNLMDRFVIGAGSGYGVGATGGSKDAIVPAHTHTAAFNGLTASAGQHAHDVNDPGHAHTWPFTAMNGTSFGGGSFATGGGSAQATSTATTGIGIFQNGLHDHAVAVSGTTDATGAAATNANLPPYYALCFIMKSA